MATATKSPTPAPASVPVPLQAVVGVICDSLADLQLDDQARAIEAVRITLGVRKRAPVEIAASSTPVSMELVTEFCRSIRPEQLNTLMQIFDMTQKIMLMEIAGSVNPPGQTG